MLLSRPSGFTVAGYLSFPLSAIWVAKALWRAYASETLSHLVDLR